LGISSRPGGEYGRGKEELYRFHEGLLQQLRVEMRKVTWPNRKQVESTTAVVIISVFAFAGYFEVVDTILSRGVKGILNFFTK
jgi:preprotein translocase SecE subunit